MGLVNKKVASLKAALRDRDNALQRTERQQAEVVAAVQQREADIVAVSTEVSVGVFGVNGAPSLGSALPSRWHQEFPTHMQLPCQAETSRMKLEAELQRNRNRCDQLEASYAEACSQYESRLRELQVWPPWAPPDGLVRRGGHGRARVAYVAAEAQAKLAEEQRRHEQQQKANSSLQAMLAEQQSDVSAALDLVCCSSFAPFCDVDAAGIGCQILWDRPFCP